jgi:hypothetical protein
VERKLAYPHWHQTRLRGLDNPPTELAVINKEEDSDTEANGSWAVPMPRYDNHEVGPRIDIWAEEEAIASLSQNGTTEAVQWGQGRSTPEAPEANARGSRCRDQIEAYGRQLDT